MFKWLLIAALPAIFAVRALFAPGFIPTHDGEYHLIRFHEFATMVSAGYLFPRWAPDLNSGYGVPLFNFHYPFPNYVGVVFHLLGVSYPDAVKLVLATAYLTAIGFCFLWLSKLFDKEAAAAGTVVFAFVPYWFVDIFVRGVVGEVWGIAWAMLLFASIERGWKTIAAFSFGLLIISHNIMALLFLPVLFVYLLLRNRSFLTPLFLGIGLSSYFWVPALLERSYVTGLNSVNFRDHFPDVLQLLIPTWGTGFSRPGVPPDEMSFQVGIVPLLLICMSMVLFLRKRKNILAGFFIALFGVAFVLMQSGSVSIWRSVPLLRYLQYPWRLLSLIIPISGYLASSLIAEVKNRTCAIFLCLFAIGVSFSYTHPVFYPPRSDLYFLSRPNFTDGTSSLGNSFSTVWSPWKKARPAQKIEVVNGNAIASELTTLPLLYKFSVDAKRDSIIRVNTLYYPGWKVLVNGKDVTIDYKQDGTITFSVLPGRWQVTARFTETPLRKTADAISILSLFWLIGSFILKRNAHRHRYDAAIGRS